MLQIAAIVHGFGTFTTLKEPKGITVTEDSVTDTSLFLTWDAVPKGPFTLKIFSFFIEQEFFIQKMSDFT